MTRMITFIRRPRAEASKISFMTDDQLLQRAIRTHARWCQLHGIVWQQPCSVASDVTHTHVVLRNRNGVLASFKIGRKHLIRVDAAGDAEHDSKA